MTDAQQLEIKEALRKAKTSGDCLRFLFKTGVILDIRCADCYANGEDWVYGYAVMGISPPSNSWSSWNGFWFELFDPQTQFIGSIPRGGTLSTAQKPPPLKVEPGQTPIT